MADPFGIQNLGEPQAFMARVVPFAGAENNAHVIVFPRIGRVWQIFVRTVEINIVVVITVEERADIEGTAEADEMAHSVGMTKSDVCSVVSPKAGAAYRDPRRGAFAPREIEHIADDHIFVGVVRMHPVRGMN